MIKTIHIHCLSADSMLAVLEIEPEYDPPLPAEAVITGTIRGPYSERSHTLPADFPVASVPGGKLAARIVDPCYTSGELPMEYEIQLTATQAGKSVGQFASRFQLADRTAS